MLLFDENTGFYKQIRDTAFFDFSYGFRLGGPSSLPTPTVESNHKKSWIN